MFNIQKPERALLFIQIKKFARYIKGDILDVGCGNKNRYGELFEKNKYVRLDHNAECNPDIVADAQNIPLPDASFDSIVCTQTLEHLAEPQKAVNEFHRLLRKDGHCLVTVPFFNEMHEEPYDFWRFTKFGLEKLFQNAGFKILVLDQRGKFFAVLAQMVIRYFITRSNLSGKISRIFLNPPLNAFSRLMLFLDKITKNKNNEKFALGWLIVVQKI